MKGEGVLVMALHLRRKQSPLFTAPKQQLGVFRGISPILSWLDIL